MPSPLARPPLVLRQRLRPLRDHRAIRRPPPGKSQCGSCARERLDPPLARLTAERMRAPQPHWGRWGSPLSALRSCGGGGS